MDRMPAPAVWGPRLWKILHCLFVRNVSPSSSDIIKSDAYRELKGLLQTLELVVPCLECKKHIHYYIKNYSYPSSLSVASDWLQTFHNSVNARLGKPVHPPISLPPATNHQILSDWSDYKNCIKESVLQGNVKGSDLSAWERRMRLFISLT
jgi:hypothetical protein